MEQFDYFPILRWKQGEQSAVKKLGVAERQVMLPIAELQQLESNPRRPKLISILTACGATQMPIAVDIKTAVAGRVSMQSVARLIGTLQTAGLRVFPAIHGTHAQLDPSGFTHLKGQPAVVIRIVPHRMLLTDATALISQFRRALGAKASIYVLLDLEAIGEVEVNASALMLETFVRGIISTCDPLQIAVAGGSFPMTLGSFPVGVNNYIPRKELEIWKALKAKPGCAEVKFGDYAVTNPEPLGDIDPRTMNPAAAIRYCLDDKWWLPRASGVRTRGRGGMGQYNDLCKLLIASPQYSGSSFSFGDERYAHHALPATTSGSFMTWRRDATNHHLTFTARQLIAGTV